MITDTTPGVAMTSRICGIVAVPFAVEPDPRRPGDWHVRYAGADRLSHRLRQVGETIICDCSRAPRCDHTAAVGAAIRKRESNADRP